MFTLRSLSCSAKTMVTVVAHALREVLQVGMRAVGHGSWLAARGLGGRRVSWHLAYGRKFFNGDFSLVPRFTDVTC